MTRSKKQRHKAKQSKAKQTRQDKLEAERSRVSQEGQQQALENPAIGFGLRRLETPAPTPEANRHLMWSCSNG
jgi:hypothetical protein